MDPNQAWHVLLGFLRLAERYWYLLAVLIALHLLYMLMMERQYKLERADAATCYYELLAALREQGYTVEQELYRGKLGADLLAAGPAGRLFIQAKWWKRPVGRDPVSDAARGRNVHSCDFAVLVSRGFGRAAVKAAKAKGVLLWEDAELAKAITDLACQQQVAAGK